MTRISVAPTLSLPDPAHSFWARIAHELVQAIARGVYVPGDRLPSENLLAQQYGVNRHTIRRSLSSLCQLGLLRSSQGSGTYVEDFAVDLVLGKRTRQKQALQQAGLSGGFEVLSAQAVRASADVAKALAIRTGRSVLHLHVLGQAQGQPMNVGDRYFPLPRFAGLDEHVRETGSITSALEALGVADYTRRQSRISARMPEAAVAASLKQAMSRPTLYISSVNVDLEGTPIEYARTWFAGDRISLTVDS